MPYKITRSESYTADQTKSGDSLKHYGRKGMKWDKNIFGKEDAPGQRQSSSNSGSAQSKKALSSALGSKVSSSGRGGSLNKNTLIHPEIPNSGRIMRVNNKSPFGIPSVEGYRTGKISDPILKSGGQGGGLNKNTLIQPEIPNSGRIMRVNNKSPFGIPSVEGYRTGKISDPILKSGGQGEAKPRSGLQKWFDQAGKDIGNTFNSAKKGVEGAANSVKKWGEGAVNDTKKWVEGAANDTKKWTDNAIKDIGKTAVKIGDDAKKAYGDAEKWVNGAIKDVGNAAVKVGDDAKKAYGDAKNWVDRAIGDAKKWTDQAGKDIGKTASDIADELVYGTKYAVGTARTAVKNAARKVKDTYERVTDTGTQRLLNPEHMTSRQKQAIWSKRATKQGVEKNLEEGLGPMVNSYDAFKAIDKKTGGKGYDVVARSGQTQRDLAKLKINSAPPQARALVSKGTPKVKFMGPSMTDAKKYLSPSDLAGYNRSLNYIAKYGEGDGSIKRDLDRYLNKVAWEKSRERNR